MNGSYNTARPEVMHIDLNSCFATVEQQSRPRLRGRPVAVLNRRTEHTMIVTASYEAKALGVTLGMKFRDAKKLCPDLVGLESDPPKYRYVYHQLLRILSDYSPAVAMKSIDEGVIDFSKTSELIRGRELVDVGMEIKHRLRTEIGCAMRCNVGIAPNRFLAKTAAGLNKPDGLDIITHENLRDVYGKLELEDLNGIAWANHARLERVGITTPLEFLDAKREVLHDMVFRSVCGDQWHARLRGWEVDDVSYDIKTCGRQYVLEDANMSRQMVTQRLHHLCEAVGAKLRGQKKCARGVGIYARMIDGGDGLGGSNGRWGRKGNYWHQKYLAPLPFYSDAAIWSVAARLFRQVPEGRIREIGIHCYHLHDGLGDQLNLFADDMVREEQLVGAVDDINARYGVRTIHSADTLGTDDFMKAKIPFGSTRYL
jgi:DNA polymerase-4